MEKYLSTGEAARILGISRIAVFKKIKSGKIKGKKIGRNFVIAEKDLLGISINFLTSQKKAEIDKAVDRTIKEYGETLKLLGQE
ncbi:MAG: excisionase family DNA-binding protein [Candidatus Yanofskybacteria bacterium]|nr:excisionase family DNA-binding protein [Candidatus Yanofskybacteria bacterium]